MLAQLLTALVGALIRSQPKKKPAYRKPTPEEIQQILDASDKYIEEYKKEYACFLNNRYRPGGYEVPDPPPRRAGTIKGDDRQVHPTDGVVDEGE